MDADLGTSSEIKILSYSKGWPKLFISESAKIRAALFDYIVEVHHIGSTAIVGMPAKPVIDIIIELKNLDHVFNLQTKLLDLGYSYLKSGVVLGRSFFASKVELNVGYHIHIYVTGDLQIKRHLLFRDYLNANFKEAQDYAQLKQNLAAKHRQNRFAYIEGKTKFVKEIDNKARIWADDHPKWNEYNLFRAGPIASEWKFTHLVSNIQANHSMACTFFAQYKDDVEIDRVPGYTAISVNSQCSNLNYVLDTHFYKNAQSEVEIDRVCEKFKYKNLPFIWKVSQRDTPNNLEKYLKFAGGELTNTYSGMTINLSLLDELSQDVRIKVERVLSVEQAGHWANIYNYDSEDYINFYQNLASLPFLNDDLVQLYVAYHNDIPIARVCLSFYAGIAGMYDFTVLKSERKKGFGTALLRYIMQIAKQKGYNFASAVTPQDHDGFFTKHGFNCCTKFKDFVFNKG